MKSISKIFSMMLIYQQLCTVVVYSGKGAKSMFYFIWVLVFLSITNSAGTIAGVKEKSKQLTETQAQIKSITRKINEIEGEKRAVINRLAEMETQYGLLTSTIKKITQQASEKQQALTKIAEKILLRKRAIARQNKALQEVFRAAYAMGENETMRLLMNQQDPAVSSRMLIYYGYFNKARLHKLQEINLELQTLRDLKLENEYESNSLSLILAKKRRQQNVLLTIKQERKKLLVKLEREYAFNTQKFSHLVANEKQLKQLIASLNQVKAVFPSATEKVKPFPKSRGQVAWPIRGEIIKKFGSKRGGSQWDGVLIAAEEGIEIHAVTGGRIVFADWLRGYGLLTIIEHDHGFMTLYAFSESLLGTVGDWVEGGEVIATVGKSGGRGQAGLYFGIRKNGKPLDPIKWCRKGRNGRVG